MINHDIIKNLESWSTENLLNFDKVSDYLMAHNIKVRELFKYLKIIKDIVSQREVMAESENIEEPPEGELSPLPLYDQPTTLNFLTGQIMSKKDIDKLLSDLNRCTLDSAFEDFGNFINDYEPFFGWTKDNLKYKGFTSFWGKFKGEVNLGFNWLSNDIEVIERLTETIRRNQKSELYLSQKEA